MSPSSPLSASGSTSSLPPLTPAPSLVIPKPSVGPIKLASIEEALQAFKRGEFLVVVDDLDRENEGDLIIAADCICTFSPLSLPLGSYNLAKGVSHKRES